MTSFIAPCRGIGILESGISVLFVESGILGFEKRNTAQEPEIPLATGYMRRFLQLRPEFIFSSLKSEFGNASKATSGVRCNIIIVQPQFANLFLIPCLDS